MGDMIAITNTTASINFNLDTMYVYIIAGALAALLITTIVLLIVVLVKQSKLTKKYNAFIRGSDAKSMEEAILKRFKEIDRLLAADAKKGVEIQELDDNLQIAVQKVGIVKYDAFKEMGGKLSFALAMLDKNNTGFVINAMHSREGCYNYIKEIVKGESYIELSEEEAESLERAIFKETLGFDLENMKQ